MHVKMVFTASASFFSLSSLCSGVSSRRCLAPKPVVCPWPLILTCISFYITRVINLLGQLMPSFSTGVATRGAFFSSA
ncbi:hypothetical protein BD408DRAFT_115169 [Parasitella parasitica]|nr:hypothetical protein BD408DRAFT_115169 [Parasitella parasitica]